MGDGSPGEQTKLQNGNQKQFGSDRNIDSEIFRLEVGHKLLAITLDL